MEERKKMFYLTMPSTYFLYSHLALDIIMVKDTAVVTSCAMFFPITISSIPLYSPSHRHGELMRQFITHWTNTLPCSYILLLQPKGENVLTRAKGYRGLYKNIFFFGLELPCLYLIKLIDCYVFHPLNYQYHKHMQLQTYLRSHTKIHTGIKI